jgi:GDPmannose 4,6-dehydratase
MWMMLQRKSPDNFVIATNESHSVKEFCKLAFACADLDYKDFVKVDKKYFRPSEVKSLCGDLKKAREIMGWEPETNFNKLVELMVKEDIKRWEKWKAGEHFPWDAFNYPNENKILSRSWNMERI